MLLRLLLLLLLHRHLLHRLKWYWWHLLHGHDHPRATIHTSSATIIYATTTTTINTPRSPTIHLHHRILMRKHGVL